MIVTQHTAVYLRAAGEQQRGKIGPGNNQCPHRAQNKPAERERQQ